MQLIVWEKEIWLDFGNLDLLMMNLECLKHVMDFFKIGYQLYHKGSVLSSNVTGNLQCILSLTSESDDKCTTLRIAESPFDIF